VYGVSIKMTNTVDKVIVVSIAATIVDDKTASFEIVADVKQSLKGTVWEKYAQDCVKACEDVMKGSPVTIRSKHSSDAEKYYKDDYDGREVQ